MDSVWDKTIPDQTVLQTDRSQGHVCTSLTDKDDLTHKVVCTRDYTSESVFKLLICVTGNNYNCVVELIQ